MSLVNNWHRVPRAGVDPIDSHDVGLAIVSLSLHRPLRHETIVVMLDGSRCGIAVVVVDGTREPDAVFEVVECLTTPAATAGRVDGIVVASVRPPNGAVVDPATDVDRWLEMSELTEATGVELVEWFVIGRGVSCPRDLLPEPPRWLVGRPG